MPVSSNLLKRPASLNPANWKFRNKILALVLAVVLVSAGGLTTYYYFVITQATYQSAGAQMQSTGHEALQRTGDIVAGSVKALRTLTLSPSLIAAVAQANQANAEQTPAELQAAIAGWDKAWKAGDPSIEAREQAIADNPLSANLKTFKQTFPEEVEVFATDLQGLNVAMTDRTSDYLQSDEGWWQAAYNGGQGAIYLSQVDYDDSAKAYA